MEELKYSVNGKIANYEFSQAGELLRDFTWSDLADWYLEACKFSSSEEKDKILILVLKDLLKLWHPFIPFATELIWSKLGEKKMLMVEKWPVIKKHKDVRENNYFELIKSVIAAIRNARAENKVEPGRKIGAIIYAGNKTELIRSQAGIIQGLRTGIGELKVEDNGDEPEGAIYLSVGDIEVYLTGAVDKKKEEQRLAKEIANLRKLIAATEGKLANKEFLSRAPKEVVEREQKNLHDRRNDLTKLMIRLKGS